MKNIKLAWKIGLGFGVLVVIACALGSLAIVNMSSVRSQSARISEEYLPEVAVANNVERLSMETMYEMRGYAFTDDEKFLAAGKKNLEEVKKFLGQAQLLAEQHPGLTKLRQRRHCQYQGCGIRTPCRRNHCQKPRHRRLPQDHGPGRERLSHERRGLY